VTADALDGPDRPMLDEMFSPRIGQILRDRGIDCVCVAEDDVLRSSDDATVFAAALERARVLVTNNAADFEILRRGLTADGHPVPPLIYADDATFPRCRNYVSQLAEALEAAAASHRVGVHGGVYWLSRLG
jgi:predicted nuclease of predicted toxin-antitoxin system